jgi:hypothetical protein
MNPTPTWLIAVLATVSLSACFLGIAIEVHEIYDLFGGARRRAILEKAREWVDSGD